MFKSLQRFAASTIAILTAYTAYSLLAVPFIEPDLKLPGPKPGQFVSDKEKSNRLPWLQSYFPEGAWELDEKKTKILVTENGELLFREFQPRPDGHVEVTPFTIIHETESGSRPIIMQAPGAVLEFDKPLDLGQTDVGRFVGGMLRGDVHIYSPQILPDDEELVLQTRNVQMTGRRIFTPHNVDFRFGKHWGRGRNLNIQLAAPQGGGDERFSFSGVESLELVHVERVHLDAAGRNMLPTQLSRGRAPDPLDGESKKEPPVPIEITCQGPFVFDVENSLASFEDRVEVLRLRHDGPADQLNCDRLEIHFTKRTDEATTPTAPASDESSPTLDELAAKRIVAIGRPVTVRSDFILEGQRLEYEIAAAGEMGAIWVDGPGVLYEEDEAGQRTLTVQWQEQLHGRTIGEEHVVSLLKQAKIESAEAGMFGAEELHIWLREIPPAGIARTTAEKSDEPQFVADRILAIRNVVADSEQLSASAGKLEAWIEQVPVTYRLPVTEETASAGDSTAQPGQAPESKQRPVARRDAPPSNSPKAKYHLQGGDVKIKLRQQGEDFTLQAASVKKNGDKPAAEQQLVQLIETKTQRADEIPLHVTGESLQLTRTSVDTPDNARVEVKGSPAEVRARGATIVSENIKLDQAENLLWIETPGKMTLPASQDQLDEGLRPVSDTVVTWKGRMDFDGRTAKFRRDVKTSGMYQLKNGELLETTMSGSSLDITVSRRISFSSGDSQSAKADLKSLAFANGFFYESHRRATDNDLISIDRLQARNLFFDRLDNQMTAEGPGWATSVHRGNGSLDLGSAKAKAPPAQAKKKEGLNYGSINFAQGLKGDLEKREVEFHGRIRCVYGPVATWQSTLDPSRAGGLGPKGVKVTCDVLKVAELGQPVEGERKMLLNALSNAVLEGSSFRATAKRMSFDQSKDLFVLAGDIREDARLLRWFQPGGPEHRATARKILYWRTENRIEVDDAKFLDLSHLGITPQ